MNRLEEGVRVGATKVGDGVYATQPYPARAIIGEILGEWISDPNYGSEYCMDIEDRRLEPYSPFRFVNHSCEPNCEFDWCDFADPGESRASLHVFLIALRNIQTGEELTIDYNWTARAAIPCECQASSCRGWIVSADELRHVADGAPRNRRW